MIFIGKIGGEGGIRTLGTGLTAHTISSSESVSPISNYVPASRLKSKSVLSPSLFVFAFSCLSDLYKTCTRGKR